MTEYGAFGSFLIYVIFIFRFYLLKNRSPEDMRGEIY